MPKATADGRPKIYPCIRYARQNVHEAAEFYTSVFPFSRILNVVPHEGKQLPDGATGNVAMVDMMLFGEYFVLVRSERESLEFTVATSLTVECSDLDELNGYKNAFLKAGARNFAPNWFIDPFGFYWHFHPFIGQASHIYPCIWYTGKHAEEMAGFYTSVFPSFRTIPAKSPEDDRPDGPLGDMTLAEFTLFDRLFQVIQAEEGLWFSDAFSLTVLCDNQQELDRYWNAFIKAGATPMACGSLTDHFGLSWEIAPSMLDPLLADKDPERAMRVQQKILTMTKLDIAVIEEAARG